jgi:GPH family glycoside/pentoside/hexuronide:cation symporter
MDSPANQHDHKTAAKDRVSVKEQWGLGLGRAVQDGTHGSLFVLASPIYNITMGMDARLLSTFVAIQRIWDAVLNPVFGQFSDNFRSRWGRRRPLIFIGAFPVAIFFALLWWFPRQSSSGYLFGYLLAISLAFYAALSLFAMPLGGLVIEATDDYHERTRIAGIALAFGFAAQIGSNWLFKLTQLWVPEKASPSVQVFNTITGVRWVGTISGILFLIMGLMPFILCRERMYAKVTSRQRPVPFMESLRAVKGNSSFMSLLWARCLFSFGYQMVGLMGGYMNIYYVFGGDVHGSATVGAILGSGYHVAAIGTSLFVYPHIERRFGKRRTLEFAAGILIVDCVSKYFLYQPGHPWLPLAIIMMNGIANAGVALMAIAMLGDIADHDEFKTGLRREGVFNSLLNWFEKAGSSLGSFLTGYLLWGIGFNPKLPSQSLHTLHWMKASYIFFPAMGAVLTLIFARNYKLTQDEVYNIKNELTRRRAIAAAAGEAESPTPQQA